MSSKQGELAGGHRPALLRRCVSVFFGKSEWAGESQTRHSLVATVSQRCAVPAPFGKQVSASAPPSGPSRSLAFHPSPSASLPVLSRLRITLDMPGFMSLPHWPISVTGRPLNEGQEP